MLVLSATSPFFLFQTVMGLRSGAPQEGGKTFSEKRICFFLDCGRTLSEAIFTAELLPKANRPPFLVMADQGEG